VGVNNEKITEAANAVADVFRNRELRRVNLALAGSSAGDWAYSVAVSIWAYQEGGVTAVGVFGVIRYVLMAVIAPFAATLADRFPRKLVMIWSDVTRCVLVVIGAAVIAADAAPLVVYALALVTSVVGSAFRPAQASLLPQLSRTPEELTGANVVASTIESLAFFVGPALCALLLAVADIPIVYLVNAATFAVSALLLLGVHVPAKEVSADDQPDESSEEGFLSEALAGFRTIARSRDLRLITALALSQTIVAGASLVYEVAIVFDLLERSESSLGILDAILGIGGLIGGFLVMVLARRQRLATDFGIGVFLWAAPLFLIVIWPSFAVAALAMAIIGLANSMVDINVFTIIQRLTPEAVMGRVFGALEAAFIAGMAIGSLAMPFLIKSVGLRPGLAVVGGVVAGMAALSMPALARVDRTALAPAGRELLDGVPMLAALPAPVLERLARRFHTRSVVSGEVVFSQGDAGDRYWLIKDGTATVSINGIVTSQLGPGDGFGEIALLRDVPRQATITATSDLELMGLDRDDFIPAVTGHGEASERAERMINQMLSFG
jgi:MFS family permease